MHLSKEAFLADCGWNTATIKKMAGDASIKRFHHLSKKSGENAVLMEMPFDHSRYSGEAQLARSCKPFLALTAWLSEQNISVPRLLADNMQAGFVLLEDLGNRAYKAEHIPIAVDILLRLQQNCPPKMISFAQSKYALPVFTKDIYIREVNLLIEWFFPYHNIHLSDKAKKQFREFWQERFIIVNNCKPSIMLRDYHSPNFTYLPKREGLHRLGILDYQDALCGSPLYDLASLLQDARIDISPAQEKAGIERYRARANFNMEAYTLLGAHRALKVLGIFVRFAKQDNNINYLRHLARVKNYLRRNLRHPICAALKDWFRKHADDIF